MDNDTKIAALQQIAEELKSINKALLDIARDLAYISRIPDELEQLHKTLRGK